MLFLLFSSYSFSQLPNTNSGDTMKKIGIILLAVLCSGCSWFKQEETRAVGKFIEEKATHFYEVEDEDELALLVLKNFEEGDLQICYRSQTEIYPYKLYLKIKSVLPVKFEMETGKLQTTVAEEVIESVDCLVIHPLESYEEVKRYIREWANEIENSHDSKEIMEQIHDLIVMKTDYSKDSSTAFCATGVFRDHAAVCEGYSLAFNDLAKSMHIPSLMISSNTINHAWNMVYLEGEWWFVDCTWDDPVNGDGRIYKDYYLMSLEELVKNERYQFDEKSEKTLDFEEYLRFAEKYLLFFE